MPTALITGASSGIGRELALLAASDRHDLVLVARRKERLDSIARELAERNGIRVTALAKDLSEPAAPEQIVRELEEKGIAVDVLVNNAGFGVHGLFAATPLDRELDMIRVLVTAPTHLTKLLLPGMLERRRGRILNVASTAAFQPGPLMAVYYAAKACMLSFSEALAEETSGTGVTVTALCPGSTPTEFQRQADLKPTALFRGPLVTDAAFVARVGWKGMKRGKAVVVPGLANRMIVQALRLAPRRLVTKLSRRVQESR